MISGLLDGCRDVPIVREEHFWFDRRWFVGFGVSPQIEGDVIDGCDHGADEGRPGEEEGPAVVVGEAFALGGHRLLAMRDLIVDRRDVEDDPDGQGQGW